MAGYWPRSFLLLRLGPKTRKKKNTWPISSDHVRTGPNNLYFVCSAQCVCVCGGGGGEARGQRFLISLTFNFEEDL